MTRQAFICDSVRTPIGPYGGAITLGPPLGMCGAQIALTAARQLRAKGGRDTLVTMCVGVGRGVGVILEAA